LFEDLLRSVIDTIRLGRIDCAVVEVCLIDDRFVRIFGID